MKVGAEHVQKVSGLEWPLAEIARQLCSALDPGLSCRCCYSCCCRNAGGSLRSKTKTISTAAAAVPASIRSRVS